MKSLLFHTDAKTRKQNTKKIVGLVGKRLGGVYRMLMLICLSVVTLFPVLYMFSVAFRPSEQLSDPTVVWIPKSLTLYNFKRLLDVFDYPLAMLNTAKITLISTFCTLVSCSLAGYGLARYKFKGKTLLFGLVVLMIIVPPQNILISSYVGFKYFDFFGIGQLVGLFTGEPLTYSLLGKEISMYLPAALGAGIRSGLFILIFSRFFSNLPKELEDAAAIDGCNPLKTYVRVVIPAAVPVFVIVSLLCVVWYWNDYYFTNTFMRSSMTLAGQLPQLKAKIDVTIHNISSGAAIDDDLLTALTQAAYIIVIGPLVLLYVFMQRYFTESIERSGIVG